MIVFIFGDVEGILWTGYLLLESLGQIWKISFWTAFSLRKQQIFLSSSLTVKHYFNCLINIHHLPLYFLLHSAVHLASSDYHLLSGPNIFVAGQNLSTDDVKSTLPILMNLKVLNFIKVYWFKTLKVPGDCLDNKIWFQNSKILTLLSF